MKTPTTAPTPTLEIRPFTVTTQWVEITIPIAEEDAALIDSRNPTVRDGIGSVVSVFTVNPKLAIKYGEDVEPYKHTVSRFGRKPKGAVRAFSFRMEKWQWESVESMAAILAATPEQFARAAISKRVLQIREYLADHSKKSRKA